MTTLASLSDVSDPVPRLVQFQEVLWHINNQYRHRTAMSAVLNLHAGGEGVTGNHR
ncbi:MAG: hypothetical protein WA888_06015 [Burkholderiaceae bacterium]